MKIRKSTLKTFIFLFGYVFIVLSCSETESKSIQQGTLNNIRLTSPKGYQIAALTEKFRNIIVSHIAGFSLNHRTKTFS